MTLYVLDCSFAMSWVLPGESTVWGDRILREIVDHGASAPCLWSVEVAAALVVAERRRRITAAERREAVQFLTRLPVALEPTDRARDWTDATSLALTYDITVCDALYLEAAMRLRLPLATLDKALIRAAHECGIEVPRA